MANYLAVRKVADLDSDKAKYRLQGFKGTAAVANIITGPVLTNIDWKFPEDRWISGGILIAKGTHWGDKIALQIIDKDNILGYGANFVLDEYVSDFYLISDSEFQIQIESPYIALVYGNLYLRVAYTNSSTTDAVEVAMNVVCHIPR